MEPVQKTAVIHKILLNRPTRVIASLIVFAIVLPALAYMVWFSREIINNENYNIDGWSGSCSSPEQYHIMCGPKNITQNDCLSIRCCYSTNYGCIHRFPSAYQYKPQTPNEASLSTTMSKSPFGHPSVQVNYCINEIDENSLIVMLSRTSDLQPCDNLKRMYMFPGSDLAYWYDIISEETFILNVYDKQNDRPIMSTSRGPMIASEMYFEWSFYFGEHITIFGFGEYRIKEFPYHKLLWRDEGHDFCPVAWIVDNETKSVYSVRLTAYGPIEVQVSEYKIFSIRTLSSELFSIILTKLASISNILDETTTNINIHTNSHDVPYWTLGVHVVESMNTSKLLLQDLTKMQVPFDSICLNDIWWLFDNRINLNLSEFELVAKELGKHLQTHVICQVPFPSEAYTFAQITGILLKKPNSIHPYQGFIANQTVAYIDWTSKAELLAEWIEKFVVKPNETDGILLNTNFLKDDTIHQDVANSFGYHYFPDQLLERLDILLPFFGTTTNDGIGLMKWYNAMFSTQLNTISKVLGQSTTISSYGGEVNLHIWRNRFSATWVDLRSSFRQMLADALIGISLSGPNVCGHRSDRKQDEELCIRWYQLASVGSHFQISSNSTPDKFEGFTRICMLSILRRRYALLPYIHTALILNRSLIRPVFVDFTNTSYDSEVLLLGSAIIVFPVLHPSTTELTINLDSDVFELWGGRFLSNGEHSLHVGLKHLPTYLRSGYIVPIQPLATPNSAASSEVLPINLYVGLQCSTALLSNSESCSAKGHFYFAPSFMLYSFKADQFKLILTITSDTNNLDDVCTKMENGTKQIVKIRLYKWNRLVKIVTINFDVCIQEELKNEYTFYYD